MVTIRLQMLSQTGDNPMPQRPFVLIHSPLVGTLTWQSVAETLRAQGYDVFIPELKDEASLVLPFWQQEVDSIDLDVADATLVGHSGAGALLPAIGEKLNAYGYIFVDAVLLFEPATRLELMESEGAEFASQFEAYLKGGGRFPNWTDGQFQSIIPDTALRSALLADMRPRDYSFFTERIDVPAGWYGRPCAYIQLSAFYSVYGSQAERRGWPVLRRDTHHFAMLTQPEDIAKMLIEISQQL
jgi:hypothetical protein